MPRLPRTHSLSGYMHLIVRGIGRQILFEDREDHLFYLSILKRFSSETNVAIYAYCLMDNHVHLLVFDPDGNTAVFMKKMGVRYAMYYNTKYDRTGHLFQDRYRSEAIEDETYLLTVFRYILRNPQKAGICPASAYEWSSYDLYGDNASFVDTSVLCGMIGSRKSYDAFLAEGEDDCCMDYADHHDDVWAREVVFRRLGLSGGTVLQQYDKKTRNSMLRKLKAEGLSVRQIERLTGISRNIIQRA